MSAFDYAAPAELFPIRSRISKHQSVSYKRFDTSAEAIRFAMEELAPDLLAGTYLEVDEQRFDGVGMRNLYASADYPLPRARQGEAALTRAPVNQHSACRKVQL
jgi:hypothetical protein